MLFILLSSNPRRNPNQIPIKLEKKKKKKSWRKMVKFVGSIQLYHPPLKSPYLEFQKSNRRKPRQFRKLSQRSFYGRKREPFWPYRSEAMTWSLDEFQIQIQACFPLKPSSYLSIYLLIICCSILILYARIVWHRPRIICYLIACSLLSWLPKIVRWIERFRIENLIRK